MARGHPVEAWRREYNEERPKKKLGGLTPAAYAGQLAEEADTVTTELSSQMLLKAG
jgi:putative transposase